jgi:hypothetical protein
MSDIVEDFLNTKSKRKNKNVSLEEFAKFFYNTFSGDYSENMMNLLKSGGGSNSAIGQMFYKASELFNHRVSLASSREFNLPKEATKKDYWKAYDVLNLTPP